MQNIRQLYQIRDARLYLFIETGAEDGMVAGCILFFLRGETTNTNVPVANGENTLSVLGHGAGVLNAPRFDPDITHLLSTFQIQKSHSMRNVQ